MKPTDIRIRDIQHSLSDFQYRTPIKFGGVAVDRVTMLDVTVTGAPTEEIARDLAKSIAGSSLVKAAFFGADPNWGRVLATVGARAGSQGFPVDPAKAHVHIQGIPVYMAGPVANDPASLRRRLREPEVKVLVALNAGDQNLALSHLSRALEKSPDSDHAHYIMAVALTDKGDSAAALRHLEQAIALNPDNRSNAIQDPDLSALRNLDAFREALGETAGTRRRARARW